MRVFRFDGTPLKALLGVLAAGILLGSLAATNAVAEPIRGAGSTFAAPVIGRWAQLYKDARADGGDYFTLDWTVDYELVGSLAGVMRLAQPEMDFAATDVPLDSAELAKNGWRQFPIVMGGVAIVANLDGLTAAPKLTGSSLAAIFAGRITKWSDPALKADNPDLALPDLDIRVIRRQDGSGSTFALSQYLSAVDGDWKTKYGADTLINWPVGVGVEGTKNLVAAVIATPGAISYAEYGQAQRAGLAVALVKNSANRFVAPDASGVEAAASGIAWEAAADFNASLSNRAGELAYPLSTVTFAVVPVKTRSADRYRRVFDFFRLAFEHGAKDAAGLGYVPLPGPLAKLVEASWEKQPSIGN